MFSCNHEVLPASLKASQDPFQIIIGSFFLLSRAFSLKRHGVFFRVVLYFACDWGVEEHNFKNRRLVVKFSEYCGAFAQALVMITRKKS